MLQPTWPKIHMHAMKSKHDSFSSHLEKNGVKNWSLGLCIMQTSKKPLFTKSPRAKILRHQLKACQAHGLMLLDCWGMSRSFLHSLAYPHSSLYYMIQNKVIFLNIFTITVIGSKRVTMKVIENYCSIELKGNIWPPT